MSPHGNGPSWTDRKQQNDLSSSGARGRRGTTLLRWCLAAPASRTRLACCRIVRRMPSPLADNGALPAHATAVDIFPPVRYAARRCISCGGTAPHSQQLRLSVADPDPWTLLVLAIVRICCCSAFGAHGSQQQNRPLRRTGEGGKSWYMLRHTPGCRPLISRYIPPEFAPCPPHCGWVARLHRALSLSHS
jgi:hypothetical protein